MSNQHYVRRPLVSDAPASLQMPWASYLASNRYDVVSFDVWNDWRQFGSGRVEYWEIGKGSVKPTPTVRQDASSK